MTIRKALRKLYTAMCGGTTTSETAGDLINDIATDYTGGGGSSLPEPGTAGNVLMSTGESWESNSLDQKDTDYVITADISLPDFSLTISPAENYVNITAAFNAGKTVRLIGTNEQYGVKTNVIANFEFSHGLVFSGIAQVGEDQKLCVVVVSEEDDIAVATMEFRPMLTDVDSDDNGKILGVSNGAYALVSPSALSNAPWVISGTTSGSLPSITVSITDDPADIFAAAEAGREVAIDFELGQDNHVRLPIANYQPSQNDGYKLAFSGSLCNSGSIACYTVEFVDGQSASLDVVSVTPST